MDGIQPYTGPSRSPALLATATAVDPTQVKTPSDYLRALRRRIGLVLAVGVPLSVLIAVWVVRQPNIYRAVAEIMIEQPQPDSILATLISHEMPPRDPDSSARYLPNRIAMLKSPSLVEMALNDPSLARATPAGEDAVAELINNLATKQITGSSRFQVTLEGTDPARIAKTLMTLLELFEKQAMKETLDRNDASKEGAVTSLNKLKQELASLDRQIYETLGRSKTIGPGGKSIAEEKYLTQGATLLQKRAQLGEFQRNLWLAEMFPNKFASQGDAGGAGKLAELEDMKEELLGRLQQYRRRVRNFNSDPSVKFTAEKLKGVLESIDRLKAATEGNRGTSPTEAIVSRMFEEIQADEQASQKLLKELQESMPEHQRFLNLLEERDQKQQRIDKMDEKLSNFDVVSRAQKSPITIPDLVATPGGPVRPRRLLTIAMGIVVSFGMGIALVCLLEHLDHSVKVPEHLSMGLSLPLFGVIPRIRRTSLVHRGGHLWMGGVPESIEADAYRNLRASLIGSSARHGPIVTLLVTSAKAGEGKSTTALNLAATCARAGERTLLMDVDLRRPSLAGVFREDDEKPNLGLVDVLRGDLPWQRTVVRTDIPNLDFLPTGDTRDIPIEILGTLELRQLILALSHHYDRVILDGPAVLGLPDCRMLGPFVDAALLVVRSGSHELRPLKRAKSFLEQSNVALAGVVFNGLYEDLENWSSYGPNTPYGYPQIGGDSQTYEAAGGLDAPDDDPRAALPAAGSARS